MKEYAKMIDTLFERAVDYCVTSFELSKLKAIDKISSVVSTIIHNLIVCIIMLSFLLFLNIGIALWLGEVLGKVYFGLLVVAAFYLVLGLVSHFFMREWLKRLVGNYFIKQFFS